MKPMKLIIAPYTGTNDILTLVYITYNNKIYCDEHSYFGKNELPILPKLSYKSLIYQAIVYVIFLRTYISAIWNLKFSPVNLHKTA